MIARNILFNGIGGSWSILLYMLIVPIQIKFLGIDAFGLLAFISTLQVVYSIFDFGLSTTLAREVAIDDTPAWRQTRDLLQTLFLAYVLIGVLLGATLILGANWLVRHWLDLGALPASTATTALQLAGLAIVLRWPVSFLSAVLIGRRRFDLLNLLKIGSVTLAVAGGMAVILKTGDLVAFAAWNAVSASVEVGLYLVACFRVIPQLSLRPRLSSRAIAQIWRFARDMSIIAILSTILIQSDRLLLSRLEPIDQFGYYTLAYRVLFGISLVQGFVTTAMLPAFAASFQRRATEELSRQYLWASQGLIFVCMPLIAALIFFGGDLLRVWTSAATAASSAPILVVLAPAFLLSSVLGVTATLAIAAGLTGLVIRFSGASLLLYLPGLYLAIITWGPIGAASAWLVLNIVTFAGLLPLVQRQVIGQVRTDWLALRLLPLVVAGSGTFGIARALLQFADWQSDVAILIVCILAGLAYSLMGLRLLDPVLREKLWQIFRSFRLALT